MFANSSEMVISERMSEEPSRGIDYETVCAIKDDVLSKMGDYRPQIGIILGSGLGGLGEHIEKPIFIDYKDVNKFPSSTVAGHKGSGLLSEISFLKPNV